MKEYKRKYQAEWMSNDIKPKKIKRQIEKSVRQSAKKAIRKSTQKKSTDDRK